MPGPGPITSDPLGALATLRVRAGLTQDGLATKAGVSYSAVRRLEQGGSKQGPWLSVAVRLANALGVTLDVLAAALAQDRHTCGRWT